MELKLLHLSDTHGFHNQLKDLPDADVIIHSGDFTFAGTEKETVDFIEWFCILPYKYKIFIAGNHDEYLFGAEIDGLPENCFYLNNSSVTISNTKFYGIPLFLEDVMFQKYDKFVNAIPNDTDVLITHQPPSGILDQSGSVSFGSPVLLQNVSRVQPKYHLFGHIHDAYGVEKKNETLFVNASVLDSKYELKNKPVFLG